MDGGHISEDVSKAGLSGLVASMMNEGTKNRTPEELEDAIGLLGASIRFSSGSENISVNVSTLKRNFEKTIALVEEMLLEPRWDEEQFELAKDRIINNIERNRANPSYLASNSLNKLVFGDGNILAVDASGTRESVSSITIDDLKDYYGRYFSPSGAKLVIAGNVTRKEVESAFAGLGKKWLPKEVVLPPVSIPGPPEKSAIYFVDVPGAKQSIINIGAPSLPRISPDFYSAFVANYKLGGSFNGIFNLILREEKGFTYGARSAFSGYKNFGTFSASSMVRTNSTLESVIIFKTEMEKYRENIPQEYVDFTKSALLKNNALNFETIRSLIAMLNNIASYNLPADYIKQEEAFLSSLTSRKLLELAKTYIDPARMYYVVVGDAKTQLRELEKAGLGKPVLLN
jgi:zinc protease